MTPREPDRYDKAALEIWGGDFTPAGFAAALRAEAADALERAAQGCAEKGRDYERRAAGQYEHGSADEAGYLAQRASAWRDAESLCRALKSPAAAPAAEPRDVVTGTARETYAGIDFMRGATPSEPAAPAPDPCQRCGKLGGHLVDFRFDGMLTGRWICPHCLDAQEKRIAELETAIRWACGEEGEFPTREPGQGAYWWRTELRRRARTAKPGAGEGTT